MALSGLVARAGQTFDPRPADRRLNNDFMSKGGKLDEDNDYITNKEK